MSDNKSSYGNIFKTTFLFGFVQVARLLVTVVKNKVAAILLGPSGLGTISIYNNAINLIKSGAGLGICQSAVKDVSEANNQQDRARFSYVISVTNKIVIFTSFFGLLITVALSPFLSKWGFGDHVHIIPFICLSVAVAFDIYTDNALAILKGMRHLRSLAKSTLIGAIAALITGVPLFYVWGVKGIVPSIIISALSSALVAFYYVKRVDYDKVSVGWKETFQSGGSMIKMGVSLMMSNFLSFVFSMLVVGFIQKISGLDEVGYYSAGSVLVISYFSMITTALNTDYYPRIAAISTDDVKIQEEVTKQSYVGLLLMYPIITIFVLCVHIIIDILYTDDFHQITNFTDVAVIGTLLSVVSNCLGYVLIAKQESKIYLGLSVVFNLIYIPMHLILYRYLGLLGLGLAYTLGILLQLLAYWFICYKKYRLNIPRNLLLEIILIVFCVFICVWIRSLQAFWLKCSLGATVAAISVCYTILRMKKNMNIDIKQILYKRLKYDKK